MRSSLTVMVSLTATARGRAGGLGLGALLAATGVPACGSEEPSGPDETGGAAGGGATAGGTSAGTGGTPSGGSASGGSAGSAGGTPAACDSVFEAHPPASASHLARCSAVSY